MNKPKPVARQPVIDYHEIIDYIEKKYNINVRDYAGKFHGKGYELKQKLRDEWLEENGYSNFKYVLTVPDSKKAREDWDRDSKEIDLRIEINTKMSESGFDKKLDELVPYLDHWHWMLDYFGDISNGCDRYWCLESILEQPRTPDWIKEITQLVHDEFVDDLDEEGGLEVHISW